LPDADTLVFDDRWTDGRADCAGRTRDGGVGGADPGLNRTFPSTAGRATFWGALVLQVIGQQLSTAAARAILARLRDPAEE
jgi:hypothetical protein